MSGDRELEARKITADLRDPFWDAMNSARRGEVTWLTDDGKRIAAIVPVADVPLCRGGEPAMVDTSYHADGNRCRHRVAL